MALLSMEEIKERIHQAKGRLERRFGKISEENKAKLRKAFGQDPEARKARLERMLTRKLNRNLTDKQRKNIEEKLAKIPTVHTEKPNANATVDLFELNMREGVSDYLFQGDMHLTEAQLEQIEMELTQTNDPLGRKKRQASTVFSKWTGNTVNYFFDPSTNARKKASTAAAIQYLQSRTCVNFVESSTAANRIRVFNGAGCYSAIGMTGGVQDLSLGDGCEVIGTVAHEFTHALGIFHTQMRSDRDTYVTIDLSDVPANAQGNFVKLQAAQNALYTPYEYGSFMHYGANAFVQTAGSLSIVPQDSRYAYTMGNRQISFYDIQMINEHYGCSSICPAGTSAQCKNGGVPNPRNCATCNCPLGYAGTLCDQKPTDPGCGDSLTATANWQTKEFSFGNTTDNQNVRDVFTMCNHWITAPAGKKVQTKITYMWNPQCQYGCPFNGIEIKTDANTKVTNPRFCCPEFNNQELTSNLNPTPVIAFNRYYYTTFRIEYRFVDNNGVTVPTVAPAPTTTSTTTTTKAPVPTTNCVDMNTSGCANNVAAGFCTMMPQYSFQTIKFNCGKSCGMCGKAANPCVDTHAQCDLIKLNGMCSTLQPMEAEYHCAKTCGFCEHPN